MYSKSSNFLILDEPNILYDYMTQEELDPYREMYDDWKGV